jgi:hypothetical protein
VINLGYIDDADMPRVTNAVDVACVVVADTTFGRFSYPVKLCEAMACGVAVAASATAAVSWMLDGDACFLARVGDATDHARTMLQNLGLHIPEYAMPPTWNESARKLAEWISR